MSTNFQSDLRLAQEKDTISTELSSAIQNSRNQLTIVEVQIGLEMLATEPQKFEMWADAIIECIANKVSNEDIELIAWLIVEMSFLATNAQYNFSRLCNLLDSEIKDFIVEFIMPQIPYFVDSGVEELSAEHLSNFITFLAELYDKTEVNGPYVSSLEQYITDLILIQLNGQNLQNQTVKKITQVLKLVGRHIENSQSLTEIFDKLETFQKQCTDISVKNNISQLSLLRERNWGVENYVNNDDDSLISGLDDLNISGFDALEISEEEREFLEQACREVEFNYPEEMDSDAMSDYENFLQEQTNAEEN